MTEETSEHDDLIGTVLADRYRIEKRLGHGGMGAVYLAEHVRMHKPLAIKVLHKEMSFVSEAVLRFEREAVAAGRLDHPHLVTATDFGELPDGSLYLVLEYIAGESLANVMARGPLPERRALHIGRQIAEALTAVHEAGIVHRDIKPDNVMLVDKNGEDFVKLLDFGMAKIQADAALPAPEVTRAGFVFGTPRYMAPEQAAGGATDHRSDLYSFGVLLYAMLAGDPPFSADDIRDVLKLQREASPPPLPESVSPPVAQLVMKLLEKDPAARVQTSRELVTRMDALLSGPAVRPPPPSARRRSGRPRLIRGRLGVWLLVATAVVSFIGGYVLFRPDPPRDRPEATVTASSAAAPSPSSTKGAPSAEVERLIVRAEVGEEAAWRALEARPDADRSAREWYVLGMARTAHGQREPGLEAYLRAVELDRSYADNWRILRDVLMAADDARAWEKALRIAAALPGQAGADLLFHVWSSTTRQTAKTALAKKLLETDGVRSRASEAVLVALDLRNTKGQTCETRRQILPRVVLHGDARSLLPLRKMRSQRGCGPDGDEDCFPCLRDGDTLEKAIQAAEERPAPNLARSHAPVSP